MLNFKELAENILTDLLNNGSISDILLKTKIFASKKGDVGLLEWVTRELEGYENKPPKYRILNSGLKVDVYIPFRGTARVDFPIEMIDDESVRNRLSNLPFHMPIAELEILCRESSNDGMIKMKVHVYAYQFMKEFINGDIQDAYQYTTTAAVSQILVSVKSILIDYLLKISNEEDINFNNFIKTNQQMITINNSGIVNTGSGDINAQGATVVTGDNNTIGADNKAELLRILAEIDKIAAASQPNPDYEEVVKDIKAELHKEQPAKNYLKRCFQAIPSFLMGVASSAAGNGLTTLIKSALALL